MGSGQVYARGRNRGVSVVFARDMALHSEQRRAWDRSFNGDSLKGYEQLLIKRAKSFSNPEFRARSGEAVDMSRWAKYFS